MADWQTIVAWFIVAVAATWLVRHAKRKLVDGLRGDGDQGCSACPKNNSSIKETPLVSLDKTMNRPR